MLDGRSSFPNSVEVDLDCRTCGACCGGWQVEVAPEDSVDTSLTKNDRLLGRVMRERKGMCTAFRGTVGACASCSIYATRPVVCREFEPGSEDCLVARRRNGLPVPVARAGR